jgi:hypothetical protein
VAGSCEHGTEASGSQLLASQGLNSMEIDYRFVSSESPNLRALISWEEFTLFHPRCSILSKVADYHTV